MNSDLYDIDNEKAFLGAILIDPEKIGFATNISPDYFYVARHATIFKAMLAVYERQALPDFISVVAELENNDRLQAVGGHSYIASLSSDCPSSAAIAEYQARLENLGTRRLYLSKMEKAASQLFDLSVPISNALSIMDFDPPKSKGWTDQIITNLAETPPPTEWIIDGLVAKSSLNIWFGAPGSKKSFILADAAVCVANGLDWLSGAIYDQPDTIHPSEGITTSPNKVLWIDLDNGTKLTQKRFYALLAGHQATPDGLYPISMPSPWPFMDSDEPAKLLFDTIIALDIGLVIIDNLGHITGEIDENSAAMSQVMSRLRRIADATKTGIIIIHHARKGQSTRLGDSIRGSSAVEAALDSAFYIETDDNNKSLSTIKPTKIRDGAWPKPIPVIGKFENDPDAEPNQSILNSVRFYQTASPEMSRSFALTLTILQAVADSGKHGVNAVIDAASILWDYDQATVSRSTWQNHITKAKAEYLIRSQKEGRTKILLLTNNGIEMLRNAGVY